eukprot:8378922-Lingulodinium_polyedra.AAC.1
MLSATPVHEWCCKLNECSHHPLSLDESVVQSPFIELATPFMHRCCTQYSCINVGMTSWIATWNMVYVWMHISMHDPCLKQLKMNPETWMAQTR